MTALLLSILSGVLATLAFPKFEWFFLAFAAWVPLFRAVEGQSPKRAFLLGLVMGIAHYATLVYWLVHVIHHFGALPLPLSLVLLGLLLLYLALYPACFSLIFEWRNSAPRTLFPWLPMAWVGLEWIRGHLLSGFPWELLGYSLYKQLTFIQAADILGVYGISFAIMSVNLALFRLRDSTRSWRRRVFSVETTASLLLVLAFLAYGHFRLTRIRTAVQHAPRIRVGIIQGNIPQDLKWLPSYRIKTLEIYRTLTRRAARQGAKLVVWPETAAPFYYGRTEPFTEMLRGIARSNHVYLLFGSPAFSDKGGTIRLTNRAYLVGPEGEDLGYYDKAHLVPYGEYVPLKKWFSFLGKIVSEVGDFKPGIPGHVLSCGNVTVGPLICFETIFPDLSRKAWKNGAELLVNITNDAWFGRSNAPYQHFSMLAFRSIETRLCAVRAANTGISGVILPSGKTAARIPLSKRSHLTAEVPLMREPTFYTRYGDVFALLCLVGALTPLLTIAKLVLKKSDESKRR